MYIIRVVKQEEVKPDTGYYPGALGSPVVYDRPLYEQIVESLDLQKLILAIFLANPTANSEQSTNDCGKK